MQNQFDFLNFISQGDLVTMAVAISLLAMSLASWYLILVKGYQAVQLRSRNASDSHMFWSALSIDAAIRHGAQSSPANNLARHAVAAAEHHEQHVGNKLGGCGQDEFIARAMRRTLGEHGTRLESGLTVLASVGSVAPFVGLFGTVWGIYHALVSISLSGQATLDKVAGPVGEALIMTALGLAVAIPAVLAYNTLVRSNRILLAELESFAQDLHILLTTGAPLAATDKPRQPAAVKGYGRLQGVIA